METLAVLIAVLVALWIFSQLRARNGVRRSQPRLQSLCVSLGEILPPELAKLEVEDHSVVRVAGVSHANDDGTSRQEILKRCKVPEILHLRRQPNHRNDKNAIQVLRHNGEMLGFIPRNEARLMAPEMDNGRRYVAVLTTLDGGYGQKRWRGAGVLVVKIKEGIGRG
ncbi:MAG TPA: HIRAN domain-containing protein [Terriglobia bacterium]|nr:HIRAN domain-containing protein [Terriglobia bacterium]